MVAWFGGIMMVESMCLPIPAPTIAGADLQPKKPVLRLPIGSCDTHAHLFGPANLYPYQQGRAYTPPDATPQQYRAMLRTMGFTRAVLIQPSVYGTDNRLMLDFLAQVDENDDIAWRAVAVVDAHVTDAELEQMHALGVRGIRINLVFPGGITFDDVLSLAKRIASLGWHIQFLVDVSTFDQLADRLALLPVPAVIDHMGHMPTEKGLAHVGFQSLLQLVKEGRAWVKLTGPNRVTQLQHPPYSDVDPFFLALLNANNERCLFGTDWPHVQLPTPVPNDGDLVNEFLRLVPDPALQLKVLVHNPARLYGF